MFIKFSWMTGGRAKLRRACIHATVARFLLQPPLSGIPSLSTSNHHHLSRLFVNG